MPVIADAKGHIFDLPGYVAVGRSGDRFVPLLPEECMPLPAGSELFLLPGRLPMGLHAASGEVVEIGGGELSAVAAFLSPAHTQFLTASYRTLPGAPRLPLFAYTAVGWRRGRFYVPARRVDPDRRQDLELFSRRRLQQRSRILRARHRRNRLWQHLIECALRSGCPAAKNLMLGRWEAPLPSSPGCNARCLGCLSWQPPDSCPASQRRITFSPTVAEILEVAVPHLESAPRAVVSFGQGCEGEPLLATDLLEEVVTGIRRRTARGTINLNTNASRPDDLGRLLDAGLDSVRVSLNSAREEVYRSYFRPRDYSFTEVIESLRRVRRHGRFSSLNYFVFPGLTDDPDEFEALEKLLTATRPNLIQWRNLNLDPERYWETVRPFSSGQRLGIPRVMDRLRRRRPTLRHGYYNPPLRGPRRYASGGGEGTNRKRARV